MRRVRIERDIGHHTEFRKSLLQRRDGARDKPLRIESLTSIGGFHARLDGRKERERRYLQFQTLLGNGQQAVDRDTLDAWHGIHFLRAGFPIDDEHRVNEIVRGEHGLTHEAP